MAAHCRANLGSFRGGLGVAMKPISILGVPIHPHTYSSWLEAVGQWITAADRLYHVCTVNPEFIVIAQSTPFFYQVLSQADACLADGTGLLLAARWLGQPLPSRVTGSDGVPKLAEQAAQEGWRLFLLGAAVGVAEQAAAQLQQANPTLQIVGTYAGSPSDDEAEGIIEMVNSSQADILLVAYGAPKQDLWIAQHRERLQVKVAMGVGGSFDFIAGVIPRAPYWMRRIGIEWLFRLIRQPSRWRRMLRLPVFVAYVLRYGEQPTPQLGRSIDEMGILPNHQAQHP